MSIKLQDLLSQELNLYKQIYSLTAGNEFNKTLLYQRQNIFENLKKIHKTKETYFKKNQLTYEQKELTEKINCIIKDILKLDSHNYELICKEKKQIEQQKNVIDQKLRFFRIKNNQYDTGRRFDQAV